MYCWYFFLAYSHSVMYVTVRYSKDLLPLLFVYLFKDAVWDYFACRRNLYCIAGFSSNPSSMKDYYLSDLVSIFMHSSFIFF